MGAFHKLNLNAQADAGTGSVPPSLASATRSASPLESSVQSRLESWNDETAARYYTESVLQDSGSESLTSLVAPESAEVVPDLRVQEMKESPLTGTRRVGFVQTRQSIPIFGTRAVVELNGSDRTFVSIDATLSDPPDVSSMATISPEQARAKIATAGGRSEESMPRGAPPELQYFLDEGADRWHLVYYFRKIDVVPPELTDSSHRGHGHLAGSPRVELASYDYLVDAHDGEIVYWFSSAPQLDVPVACRGVDEEGRTRDFFGLTAANEILLSDPMRGIDTYDLNFADITTSNLPAKQVVSATTNFGNGQTAGVTAHVYASLVFDFFNDVLKRNGIDDKGMRLVSMVNCTYSQHNPPPEWLNAVWWNNRMWYGQRRNGGGFQSYARFFDVVAHELTHGVTETTSDLVYRDLPGALNESFSDIFGIMVKNWFPSKPNAISTWDWQIGAGLGPNGGPLRDLQDPTRTGDPVHMSSYVPLPVTNDFGGVHTYSNIHNKAAYNLLTATDSNQDLFFMPQELAILYYLTLTKLNRLANFSDCLRTLKSVAGVYFQGSSTWPQKRQAIVDAYAAVGIV